MIGDYLEVAGHGADDAGALFRPLRNNCTTGGLERAITPDAVYKLVRQYSTALGFAIGAHALRATAATNALDHQADIAKVQEWLKTPFDVAAFGPRAAFGALVSLPERLQML